MTWSARRARASAKLVGGIGPVPEAVVSRQESHVPLHERHVPEQRAVSLYAAVSWLLWLCLLASLAWAAHRSLALGDEGYVLLGYKHPGETINSTMQFALMVSRVFGWLHPGVVTFRLLKLLLGVLSVAIFALGLSRWMTTYLAPAARLPWTRVGVLLPFVGIGNLFGYGLFGQALSYNSLNADILLVCYGILLLIFASPRELSLGSGSAYFLVGVLEGFQFFVKFSSSVVFFCVCAVAVALLGTNGRWQRRPWRVALLAVGYLAGMALFFLLFLDFSTWLRNFRSSMISLSGASHSPHDLLSYSMEGYSLLLVLGVLQAFISGALFYLLRGAAKDNKRNSVTAWLRHGMVLLAGIALTLMALLESIQRSSGAWGTILGVVTVMAAGVGLLALCVSTTKPSWLGVLNHNLMSIGVTMLLLIAPLIGALGSNVPVLVANNVYASFWFATIAVMLTVTPRLPWNRHFLPFFWLAPMVIIAGFIVQGVVVQPFGVPTSLFAQTEVLSRSGDLRSLEVDHSTNLFFQGIRQLLARKSNFRPGDPVIAAYNLPGLVYVLGGVSPGAPTFYGDENEQGRNCHELRSTHVRNLSRTIVIEQEPMRLLFRQCLRTVGIAFPDGYRLAGMLKSSYGGGMVKVFVPLAQAERT